ncbi:DUF6527 family protein [Sphingomonas sp. UYP23]
MSAALRLRHDFVDTVPEQLDEGVLYVSLGHATMLHLCACGCGSEVVLPLAPTDWKLTFDGVAISVWPSVGSWSLACRSHYVVDRGRVRWAGDWTDEEVAEGRRRDRRRKTSLEAAGGQTGPEGEGAPESRTIDDAPGQEAALVPLTARPGPVARLWRWLGG